MPAKKRTTKKRAATAKKRVERDIRRAVDSIPELLVEKTPPPTDMKHEHEMPKKRRVLAIGVASFSLLILGLWYWNARTMVSRVFASQSTEQRLLSQATDNFQKTFDEIAAADEAARLAREAETAEREEKVASALATAFSAYATNATSTPTTTDALTE